MVRDLEMIHSSLDDVLKTLQLPRLSKLESPGQMLLSPTYEEQAEPRLADEFGLSRDSSPKPSPEDEHELPKVPINSVYQLTKLRALRSPDDIGKDDTPRHPRPKVDDLVSRGNLSLEDAERLFTLYRDHLDPFMYGIGGRYETLETLRHRSTILTTCIFTVSALHDPESNKIYGGTQFLLITLLFMTLVNSYGKCATRSVGVSWLPPCSTAASTQTTSGQCALPHTGFPTSAGRSQAVR